MDRQHKKQEHPLKAWRKRENVDLCKACRLVHAHDPSITVAERTLEAIERGFRRPSYELSCALASITSDEVTAHQIRTYPYTDLKKAKAKAA